jgi:SAM-dependent methyltransferase
MTHTLLRSAALLCFCSAFCQAAQPCDVDHLAALQKNAVYHQHGYTFRGLLFMKEVFPDGVQLSEVIDSACREPGFAALEIGCGSAHSLMDMQHACPSLRLFGTNFGAYEADPGKTGMGQATGEQSQMIAIAQHFKVPVLCDSLGEPILPTVHMAPSISDKTFSLAAVFPVQRSFDLIVSRDALNIGKVASRDSHAFIPHLLRGLRPGGLIVAHLTYGSEVYFANVPGFEAAPFHILRRTTLRHGNESVRLLLYSQQERRARNDTLNGHGLSAFLERAAQKPAKFFNTIYGRSFWALAMEKCVEHCVLDAVPGEVESLTKANLKDARLQGIDLKVQMRYSYEYYEHLLAKLKLWEEAGEIPT